MSSQPLPSWKTELFVEVTELHVAVRFLVLDQQLAQLMCTVCRSAGVQECIRTLRTPGSPSTSSMTWSYAAEAIVRFGTIAPPA